MAAESPVSATTARLTAETIFRSAAPKGFCTALSNRRKKPVTPSTALRTAGMNSFPMVICTLSQAEPTLRKEPASVSFIRAAISAAEPPPASSCLAYSAMAPTPSFSISSENPAMASSPTIIFIAAICSAVPMFLRPAAISPSTLTGLRRLPALSLTVTPSFWKSSCTSLVGAAILFSMALSVVPAWLPLMPTLPSSPTMAAVSSNESPALRATGATYFIVSPSNSIFVLAVAQVRASTSATRVISSAFIPNAPRMSEEMSAARPRSVAVAAARFSTPGSAAMFSLAEKPAMARYCSASPTCTAVNWVVAPSSRAVASSAAISSDEARDTAPTFAIWSSNPAATPTQAPNAPSMTPAASATGAMPSARSPMRFPSDATPPSTPFMAFLTRPSGPEIISTKDNVAKTLKTSMGLLPFFISVNHTCQRGEVPFLHPCGLAPLDAPILKIVRRRAMQPVKDKRVPLPEGVRGRR